MRGLSVELYSSIHDEVSSLTYPMVVVRILPG